MKNSETIPTKEKSNPTTPGGKIDIDALAKLWIEIVLQQIQKAPVVFSKNSSYNNIIGRFDIGEL